MTTLSRQRHGSWIPGAFLVVALLVAGCAPGSEATNAASPPPAAEGPRLVTALGRIEPRKGILRVAGPSRSSVVIAELLVEEGERVEKGAPIAVLDSRAEDAARVARAKAELDNARTELARLRELMRQGLTAVALRDTAQLKVDVAVAELQAAEATLELDTVRAPIRGQIIEVHARSGERVGPNGIAEIADTNRMYAVAEVYETDIGRVHVGQRAVMRSPVLAPDLEGLVERIGLKVGKLEARDPDPIARTDARVVEVEIALDDGARAAGLSNLQVDVVIHGE